MHRTHRKSSRRAGFTLIELLVVIAILAILTSLISAAVMNAWGSGYRAKARTEISKFESALQACNSAYPTVTNFPSRLVLHRNVLNYTATEQSSKQLLLQMFGKSLFSGAPTNIAWNGKTTDPATTTYNLYGQQCLVFYTGGIPDPTAKQCTGFSTNHGNPGQTTGSRNGPWFDFEPARLVRDNQGFFVYEDPYPSNAAKPANYYAFFSSNGSLNGYVITDCTIPAAVLAAPSTKGPTYPQPYIIATGKYQNPNGYQILCAGADGEWATTNNAAAWTYTGTAGVSDKGAQDNQANFAPAILGTTQN
jgi:prepilin-type N-terminal cleavage/methylation domain-containing protein